MHTCQLREGTPMVASYTTRLAARVTSAVDDRLQPVVIGERQIGRVLTAVLHRAVPAEKLAGQVAQNSAAP
jgi:hypothetical protein